MIFTYYFFFSSLVFIARPDAKCLQCFIFRTWTPKVHIYKKCNFWGKKAKIAIFLEIFSFTLFSMFQDILLIKNNITTIRNPGVRAQQLLNFLDDLRLDFFRQNDQASKMRFSTKSNKRLTIIGTDRTQYNNIFVSISK